MSSYDQQGDTTGLLSPNRSGSRGRDAYGTAGQNTQSSSAKLAQLAFAGIVVVMVLISFILSIVRTATVDSVGGLYILLGLSLLGFVAIAILLLVFIRNGDLESGKQWFLYFIGACLVLESIFTNILLYE